MADHQASNSVIIVGSGPAGLTAAVYCARARLNPLVIEGKAPGGQLMGTTAVENWPGEKSIQGPQLMMNMKKHAQAFGTQFLSEHITHVDFSARPFTLTTSRDKALKAPSIILAMGAVPNKLGCPGEEEYWGKGVSTCAVCDGAFYKDKKVLIVGGGDTAMEDASFMTKFTDDITIVQITESLTASKPMQERVLDHPNISIMYNTTVKKIIGDGQQVTGTTIHNQKTDQTKDIPIEGIFLAIGYQPNTAILQNQVALDEHGYITVQEHTHTSVEGVFAAGDAVDYRYRQAITSAGSGCMAALDAERWLKVAKD